MNRLARTLAVAVTAAALAAGSLVAPAQAEEPAPVAPAPTTESKALRVTTTTGVSLAAQVKGAAPLAARPTVVEFTPYGENGASFTVGPDYNFLTVQIRGTGDSDGDFDVLGPKTQQDVFDTLQWACQQPWSNGDLAVAGFSASAITLFNSLHRKLPCVKAAIMRSGTFELYRDLLVPGGISNSVPGLVVLLGIGALALAQGPQRLSRNPASTLDAVRGLLTSGLDAGLLNPTLNTFWKERGFRGDATQVPTLLIDGTFDVEPRGDYQAFQQLRSQGTPARLLVVGAHDGAPRGSTSNVPSIRSVGTWVASPRNPRS
ncbi:MAG: CocE/NonD family hydrolase, partial [Actinomycetales bacterium]